MQPQPEERLGYHVQRKRWSIGGRSIVLVSPADVDALLDLPSTHERFRRDEYMPYWAQMWPASALLAEHLLAGGPGAGREALEIGCGLGVVSIAAAMAGWRVTASDYDQDAVAFAELNAAENQVQLAGARVQDYRETPDSPDWDMVFGSDLLYERGKCEPVARFLAAALRSGGEAILSDPNRSAADGFAGIAESLGLSVSCREAETTAPAGLLSRGRIWSLKRQT